MSLCQLRFKVKVRDQVQLAGIYSDTLGKKPRLSALLDRAAGQVSPGQGLGVWCDPPTGTPALPPQIRPPPLPRLPGCPGVSDEGASDSSLGGGCP